MSTNVDMNTPSAEFIDVLIVDWQGKLRGKRLPGNFANKILNDQSRLPLSTQAQDIWNDDRDEIIELSLTIGDPDGVCVPGDNAIKLQPWNPTHAQVLTSLYALDGAISEYDVRGVLMRELDRWSALQWLPTVAVELEFYLFDASTRTSGVPQIPRQLSLAGAPQDLQLYDLRIMDQVSGFLDKVHRYSESLDIPAQAALAEFGPGQFEINLEHRSKPLQAADDAIIFKQIVDRAARDSGLYASFMAKPYAEHGGSGQHVHVSVIDKQGNNIFDQGDQPNRLLHSVSGCLEHMDACLLMFAPHGNSYRRLLPGSFAPNRLDWGYDHRGVAVRLPETSGKNARLEHRVAGADANPYLVLASILGCMRHGLQAANKPASKPLLPGDTPAADRLTHDWLTAIDAARGSSLLAELLGPRFVDKFTAIKEQEAIWFNGQVNTVDWNTYLTRV